MLMASVTVELALSPRWLYSNNFLNFLSFLLFIIFIYLSFCVNRRKLDWYSMTQFDNDINIPNRIPLQIQNLQNGDKDQRRRKTLDLENPNLEMTSLVLGSRYGNQKTSTRS